MMLEEVQERTADAQQMAYAYDRFWSALIETGRKLPDHIPVTKAWTDFVLTVDGLRKQADAECRLWEGIEADMRYEVTDDEVDV